MGAFEKKLQEALDRKEGKAPPSDIKEKKSFWQSFNDSKNKVEKDRQDKADGK